MAFAIQPATAIGASVVDSVALTLALACTPLPFEDTFIAKQCA
eukprot:CAMPEP_0172926806 /NCGR_PEP_ID=MMETSP1075-20121228/216316_1 /TAXON_ID=2916 /ORGANISM="Ceratium fusus, Strain PA161109" /LENGTH=42 /DNA_ID= /DNA_START= /DNA_END= /DNA_ORIENTATION=